MPLMNNEPTLRILALEPYYGGSHKAFLDAWSANSRHEFTVLSLPPFKWKWRMRHAAITFAGEAAAAFALGEMWDAIFCSDMLNLAEFLGMVPPPVRSLPAVVYFHENQATYPIREDAPELDFQPAITNFSTALAARKVWFNSAYHRDSFLKGIADIFKKMPDYRPTDETRAVKAKISIHPPGIDPPVQRPPRQPGSPLRILWAARWEHDKNPEDFFAAVRILKDKGIDFRLSVIGEQFRDSPEIFAAAEQEFKDNIDRWGYRETRNEYLEALTDSDVVVSTAIHEFFGISVVEAAAAGAFPLLPPRLAYPEIFSDKEFFYDGSVENLALKLAELAEKDIIPYEKSMEIAGKYLWQNLAPVMDDAIYRATGR